MSDDIGINAITPDKAMPSTFPRIRETADIKGEKNAGDGLSKTDARAPLEKPVETEILTTTDIEIRKLHALRRAKEYLEMKVAGASENDDSAPENESVHAMAYNHSPYVVPVYNTGSVNPEEENAGAASYKTGAMLSGYKTFKKDKPKPVEEAAMDEKR